MRVGVLAGIRMGKTGLGRGEHPRPVDNFTLAEGGAHPSVQVGRHGASHSPVDNELAVPVGELPTHMGVCTAVVKVSARQGTADRPRARTGAAIRLGTVRGGGEFADQLLMRLVSSVTWL